ncbi:MULTISPECIES: hypothetical protein [Rhizobium]|uniref:hypothetical protein n=1 Tax=Rhizobium TaxID=379 RepID=UPI001B334A88|nr:MULTISPECIES: hypothetical protein [Rhizobium]MBX4905811.1 hypothetical protein [Rhizobium bangladeshense]MBX5212665.1 hypothetical protein [Rhizobium sp. NLR9a]MBX5220278.1 hypothetical protein [Rhizobium sp. NLR8a]MBX5225312.1 hypothetical protein [Rhizobium sp. NLR9b]MBX5238891.1 hypothetical protein [Rhizobium sp. NLR22b]
MSSEIVELPTRPTKFVPVSVLEAGAICRQIVMPFFNGVAPIIGPKVASEPESRAIGD